MGASRTAQVYYGGCAAARAHGVTNRRLQAEGRPPVDTARLRSDVDTGQKRESSSTAVEGLRQKLRPSAEVKAIVIRVAGRGQFN